MTTPTRSSWLELARDSYLDNRHRNWVLAEEVGDVVFVPARGVILVHRARAEHIVRALGGTADVARVEPAPAPLTSPRT